MTKFVLSSLVLVLVAGAAASARPNFPETEPNNTRPAANILTLDNADTISGTVASSADPDYFRVLAPVNPVKAIYLHSLAITSGGTGNSFTTRGINVQSGGTIPATVAGSDGQLLSGRVTGDVIKWYDFGNGGGIDIRAGRGAAGSAAYSLTHTIATITPINVTVTPGSYSIASKYQGDGEVYVYDSNFNLVAQNDNRPPFGSGAGSYTVAGLSGEVQNFNIAAGQTFYVAIGHGNVCNSIAGSTALASAIYDDFNLPPGNILLRQNLLDVANSLHRPGNAQTTVSTTNVDYSLYLNGALAQAQTSTINGQEVAWYALVAPAPLPCVGDADGDRDRDFADITAVLANFGATGAPFILGDADGNGAVEFADITAILANFGAPCP